MNIIASWKLKVAVWAPFLPLDWALTEPTLPESLSESQNSLEDLQGWRNVTEAEVAFVLVWNEKKGVRGGFRVLCRHLEAQDMDK